MERLIILLLIGLFCTFNAKAQEIIAHDRIEEKGYNFWFFTPQSITSRPDTQRPAKPLVIFLHGASLCGNNLSKVLNYGPLDALRRGRDIDAYILAPQNPGGSWNPKKIITLVDWAIQTHNTVDKDRVYVLGMSLGGYGTIDFTATYPEHIAASMALCGGGTVKDVSGLLNVPLWILHGTADRDVAIKNSDAVVNAMKDKGDTKRLIYTRLKGADHGDPARLFYIKKTYDWLFKHRLSDKDRPVNQDLSIDMNDIKNAYADIRRRDNSRIPVINKTVSTKPAIAKATASKGEKTTANNTTTTTASGAIYHTIQKGDNPWLLAKKYGTTSQKILELNGLTEKQKLQIGQTLRIK